MSAVPYFLDAIVALWEEAEHDHARVGMMLTLKDYFGPDFFPGWWSTESVLPSSEEMRSALLTQAAMQLAL